MYTIDDIAIGRLVHTVLKGITLCSIVLHVPVTAFTLTLPQQNDRSVTQHSCRYRGRFSTTLHEEIMEVQTLQKGQRPLKQEDARYGQIIYVL